MEFVQFCRKKAYEKTVFKPIYLGKSGRDSRPPAPQSAVRLPEAHLHLQAEGQRDQSEAASDEAEPAAISAEDEDLSNSPEGVANWATNNKHVDNTNNIIPAAQRYVYMRFCPFSCEPDKLFGSHKMFTITKQLIKIDLNKKS